MTTKMAPRGHVVVPQGATREDWLQARGEGVTASEVLQVARGGASTWRRLLEQKMNGSKFRGNAATRAGQEREAALLDEAGIHPLFATASSAFSPNTALYGADANTLHRATPDGIGLDRYRRAAVVEVKSHQHGWDREDVPFEHLVQMQWQMHVIGAEFALYGFEVRDEDDQPPIDGATWIEVPRDDEMIAWLTDRADSFIAWRGAGCPSVDALPPAVAEANDAWSQAKVTADAAAKKASAAASALKQAVAEIPHAERFGAVGMGEHGGFQVTVTEHVSLDESAWLAGDPDSYEKAQKLRVELAYLEGAAIGKYKTVQRRSTLRFQEAGK